MSERHMPEDDDIDLDHARQEVEFRVCDNNFGAVYLDVPFARILELAEKIQVTRSVSTAGDSLTLTREKCGCQLCNFGGTCE